MTKFEAIEKAVVPFGKAAFFVSCLEKQFNNK